MRVLVLEEGRVWPWVLEHLVSPETRLEMEVEVISSFTAACERVRDDPPDAVIASISPAALPWQELQRLCASRVPPIPVLYESCVHASLVDAGIETGEGYVGFLPKPASRREISIAIEALLGAVPRNPSTTPGEGEPGDRHPSARIREPRKSPP